MPTMTMCFEAERIGRSPQPTLGDWREAPAPQPADGNAATATTADVTIATLLARSAGEGAARGRAIAMTADEVDAYLRTARTCRVGSVGADGAPHVSALWFVWDGTALWLNSLTKSQRWTNVVRSPRVSVLVDGGDEFMELHGVEIIGEAEVVGEVPRTEAANPALAEPERLFGDKYAGGRFVPDGRHAWLRVVPDKVVSWDFRKIGTASAGG